MDALARRVQPGCGGSAVVTALLAVAAGGFVVGALTAYKLSGVASSSPLGGATPDVVSMREWQQGMEALRRADGRPTYLWDLFGKDAS